MNYHQFFDENDDTTEISFLNNFIQTDRYDQQVSSSDYQHFTDDEIDESVYEDKYIRTNELNFLEDFTVEMREKLSHESLIITESSDNNCVYGCLSALLYECVTIATIRELMNHIADDLEKNLKDEFKISPSLLYSIRNGTSNFIKSDYEYHSICRYTRRSLYFILSDKNRPEIYKDYKDGYVFIYPNSIHVPIFMCVQFNQHEEVHHALPIFNLKEDDIQGMEIIKLSEDVNKDFKNKATTMLNKKKRLKKNKKKRREKKNQNHQF